MSDLKGVVMKWLMMLMLISLSIPIFAQSNVLDSHLKKNQGITEAIFILDKDVAPGDVFLNYQKDLLIISIKNSFLVGERQEHLIVDQRLRRTLIHQIGGNRVDFRIRFKKASLLKPEFNEISVGNKRVTVRMFRSFMQMNNFHKQVKLREKQAQKLKTVTVKKEKQQKISIVAPPKTATTTPLMKKEPKTPLKKDETQTSNTAGMNSSWLFLLLVAGGGIAFYMKKKRPFTFGSAPTQGIKVISSRSIDSKKQLLMVEANNQLLLLGASEQGIQLISRFQSEQMAEQYITQEMPQQESQPQQEPKQFNSTLDREIDHLEQRFFEANDIQKHVENPYQKMARKNPEVVTSFSGVSEKKLRNIKKL